MATPPLSDEEITALAAKYPRGLYEAGIDEGVRRSSAYIEEQRQFIESLHSAIRALGFGPLGLSKEQEILRAVQTLAEQRKR